MKRFNILTTTHFLFDIQTTDDMLIPELLSEVYAVSIAGISAGRHQKQGECNHFFNPSESLLQMVITETTTNINLKTS